MACTHAYSAVVCREPDRPDTVRELLGFRRELFVDRLGWELSTDGGIERDQFDTPDAVHCALYLNEPRTLVGGFRAIPTDKDYLAADVFGHLATIHPLPRTPERWEITRFGVSGPGPVRQHARVNYAVMLHLALATGARGLVALVDLGHERLLAALGIRTRRYGPPSVIGTDRWGRPIEAVVGEIPLHGQDSERFRSLVQLVNLVEIADAAHVLGPCRVSA